ncbi:MAG: type II toxin-antitoxin system VapC family toxin [Actinomycetota bacterium]
MLVVDASVALPACGSPEGFALFGNEELVAPPLLWSESRSALHEALWRREISRTQALQSLHALERSPIRRRTDPRLGITAWELADELGWAKTYDAEYLALARLLRCKLVTLDERLRRGADRLGLVVAPSDL